MRYIAAIAALLCALVPTKTLAEDDEKTAGALDRIGVGAGVSTLGLSVQPSLKVFDQLVLRVSGNYGSYNGDDTIQGVDYKADMDFLSAGLIADWHPFANGFHLSGGGFYNQNSAEIEASGSVDVQGTTYDAQLTGEIDVNEFAPYVGIGYDNTMFGDSGISFWVEAGVLYQGSPTIALSDASGTVPTADLDAERREIEDALDVPFYPVIGIGLKYRF